MSELTGRVKSLYLWCAGVVHTDLPPELQEEVLTTPLRSWPSVIREVWPWLGVWSGKVRRYGDRGLRAPGDGPSVIKRLRHGHRRTHEYPVNCDQSSRNVAAKLRKLDVGAEGECIR